MVQVPSDATLPLWLIRVCVSGAGGEKILPQVVDNDAQWVSSLHTFSGAREEICLSTTLPLQASTLNDSYAVVRAQGRD